MLPCTRLHDVDKTNLIEKKFSNIWVAKQVCATEEKLLDIKNNDFYI